jgi:hypothetical protein
MGPTPHPIVMPCRLIPSSFAYDLYVKREPRLASSSLGAILEHHSITATEQVSVNLDDILQEDESSTINCSFLVLRTRNLPATRNINEEPGQVEPFLADLLVVPQDQRRVTCEQIGYCYVDGIMAAQWHHRYLSYIKLWKIKRYKSYESSSEFSIYHHQD